MVAFRVEEGSETPGVAAKPTHRTSKLVALGMHDEGREFVGRVCGTLRRQGIALDVADMMGFGFEGLLEAAERFDPGAGVEFRSFAFFRVRGAILDGVRKMGALSRRGYRLARAIKAISEGTEERGEETSDPYAALRDKIATAVGAMTISLYSATSDHDSEIPPEPGEPTVEDRLGDLEMKKKLVELVSELPEPERGVIRGHYLEDRSFEEISNELEVSRSWVCRIHRRGVQRLNLRLRAQL